MPATCTFRKVGEKRVSFRFRECPDSLEVLHRWLHEPCIKRIKILRDLNFGPDANVLESKPAKLAGKLSYDEPISKLPAGEIAESAP